MLNEHAESAENAGVGTAINARKRVEPDGAQSVETLPEPDASKLENADASLPVKPKKKRGGRRNPGYKGDAKKTDDSNSLPAGERAKASEDTEKVLRLEAQTLEAKFADALVASTSAKDVSSPNQSRLDKSRVIPSPHPNNASSAPPPAHVSTSASSQISEEQVRGTAD